MNKHFLKSGNNSSANMNEEKFSDLIARLKKYDENSQSYRLDPSSLLPAVQMVLGIFPHRFHNDKKLKEKILRGFVITIIPGADPGDENLIKMYTDNYYPFSTYCGYFVYDLQRRSKKLFRNKKFTELSLKEKTEVVQNALSGNELTGRLYKGAILMAQVSYYGAVYNEERGCPMISFPGKNNGYKTEETTYSFSDRWFDKELSPDGHPW